MIAVKRKREISFKELTLIMEAGKSKICRTAGWKSQQELMFQSWVWRWSGDRIPSLGTSLFSLKASADPMRTTHSMEGNVLYSVYWLNVHHIWKILSQQHLNWCLTKQLHQGLLKWEHKINFTVHCLSTLYSYRSP